MWLSVNDNSLIEKSSEWFIHEEMEIEREATTEKSFNGQTIKPKSVNFVIQQERKKRYKNVKLD